MTVEELFNICGGKENFYKYRVSCGELLNKFIQENKLTPGAEDTYEIINAVFSSYIEDIRESWYRASLGKTWYH